VLDTGVGEVDDAPERLLAGWQRQDADDLGRNRGRVGVNCRVKQAIRGFLVAGDQGAE
jgi:hypothetical protein